MMSIQTSENEGVVTITMTGRFIFDVYKEFRLTYKNRPAHLNYIIDTKHTQYMDSSALGMLLVLHEHNGSETHKIKIINCQDDVFAVLQVVNFQKIFDIKKINEH